MTDTHPTAQKFAATAHSSIQIFQQMADVVLSASEQMVNLNLDAARSMCAYVSSQASLPVKSDLQANLADRSQAHSAGIERASEYLRNVSDICLRTQSEMAELGARHFTEVNQSMQSLFGEVARINPLDGARLFGAQPASKRASTRASS